MTTNLIERLETSVSMYYPVIADDVKKMIRTGTARGVYPEWKIYTMIGLFKHHEGFEEFVLGFMGGDIHDLS